MALYSKNGEYPSTLPHRIKFSDGTTKTDPSTFTDEDLVNAGYVSVDNPPTAIFPQRVVWDGTNWIVRDPNQSETDQRWDWIRSECERLLFETDYKVIKAIETNTTIDPLYVQYRQELRDLYNNVNNIDPWNFTWPQINNSDLSDSADSAI